MSAPTMRDAVREVAASIGRGKGTVVLAKTVASDGASQPYALAMGSINAVKVNGGVMITIGLRRDQLEKLRDACDEALADVIPS